MKLLKYLCIGISALSILSCSDWTSEEREVFENQEGMHRLIPLIEAQTEEDLTPTMREYFAQIREYRKTPHVKGFGWFGNWTGKGNNAQNYLKMLPDSVDFVSLWGTRGYLSDEQKADLKFFQEVKGGKALLCWIIQDLGDQLTPKGLNATQYWVEEKGQGNFIEGVKAYANAICDSIEKYNLDGFDIDYEPGYGHSGTLANYQTISILSCSDWTSEEREVFENQEGMHRLIPLIEAQTEEDLTPTMREYFAQIREYRKTPHVKGFGWFGNWTGKGNNAQNYLKMLPDSVDFVSLWGTRGYLSDEQKADLKFFQEVKGGKALLCWIIQDLGDQLTPKGLNATQYWVEEKGQGNFIEGVKAYANAICDSIEKYNLDGFDIDYEPGYGHSGTLANYQTISPSGNNKMQVFIETLSARLRPAGRMLVMDGQPDLLSTETSKLVDHYIYQAYWESSTSSVIYKINKPNLDDWERKTIITVEFEQGWKTGGITYYTSVRPELNSMEGNQILDYATLDLPSGKRIGGIGTYHMEYDYPNDPPYKWLRKALYFGNQVYPGKFD